MMWPSEIRKVLNLVGHAALSSGLGGRAWGAFYVALDNPYTQSPMMRGPWKGRSGPLIMAWGRGVAPSDHDARGFLNQGRNEGERGPIRGKPGSRAKIPRPSA